MSVSIKKLTLIQKINFNSVQFLFFIYIFFKIDLKIGKR